MRRFHCNCGQEVFFEDSECSYCGRELGFDPQRMNMVLLERNRHLTPCSLRKHAVACNWLIAPRDYHEQCLSCRLTRTIPAQNVPINVQRWKVLESSKRRLIYSLLHLGLPFVDRERDPEYGLTFDFLEDQRTNPFVKKSVVYTGHQCGIITLNAIEADDAHRISTRERMNERYRTVLGHMRHEIGHYYWDRLIQNSAWYPRFRNLFGGEENYRQALEYYYTYGPVPHWHKRHISAYASAHPWEDWAETWAHYLHIMDTLETAIGFGLLKHSTMGKNGFLSLMKEWQQLTTMMNALNRSMGQPDAYPFTLTKQVIVKLRFIHQLIAG